uniref:Uncharacterized protein n=1 Tax=Candidatus Kentrum sp. MB TaxID=2138164 RepID=A0A450XD24_9GAMM|nr:MAG: hypothetical protein BECKMB1821G_GA0114241_10263 [Candidatus Kentron sp. MB]VFK31022.1 MAG: hypothetical protein BECKMB1821I_GA0114274_10204 [Candidatus Kentron sp. MB]VFK75486.1 MAG: hypothetical protein BECKMB1821H_GA0114242_10243 [Candidatus Kentron sp. MB]
MKSLKTKVLPPVLAGFALLTLLWVIPMWAANAIETCGTSIVDRIAGEFSCTCESQKTTFVRRYEKAKKGLSLYEEFRTLSSYTGPSAILRDLARRIINAQIEQKYQDLQTIIAPAGNFRQQIEKAEAVKRSVEGHVQQAYKESFCNEQFQGLSSDLKNAVEGLENGITQIAGSLRHGVRVAMYAERLHLPQLTKRLARNSPSRTPTAAYAFEEKMLRLGDRVVNVDRQMSDGRMEKKDACLKLGKIREELMLAVRKYPYAGESDRYQQLKQDHEGSYLLACEEEQREADDERLGRQSAGLDKSEVMRIYKKAREIHARYKDLRPSYQGHRPEYEGFSPSNPSASLNGVLRNFRQLGRKAGFVIEYTRRNRQDPANRELQEVLLDFERLVFRLENENSRLMTNLNHTDLVIIREHNLSLLFEISPPRTPSNAYAFEEKILSLHGRLKGFDELKESWKCREIDDIGNQLSRALGKYPHIDQTSRYDQAKTGYERLVSNEKPRLKCDQHPSDEKDSAGAECNEQAALDKAIARIAPAQRPFAASLAKLHSNSKLRGTLKRPGMSRFAQRTDLLKNQLSEAEWLLNKAHQNPSRVSCAQLAWARENIERTEHRVNRDYDRLASGEQAAVRGDFRYLEEEIRKAEELAKLKQEQEQEQEKRRRIAAQEEIRKAREIARLEQEKRRRIAARENARRSETGRTSSGEDDVAGLLLGITSIGMHAMSRDQSLSSGERGLAKGIGAFTGLAAEEAGFANQQDLNVLGNFVGNVMSQGSGSGGAGIGSGRGASTASGGSEVARNRKIQRNCQRKAKRYNDGNGQTTPMCQTAIYHHCMAKKLCGFYPNKCSALRSRVSASCAAPRKMGRNCQGACN